VSDRVVTLNDFAISRLFVWNGARDYELELPSPAPPAGQCIIIQNASNYKVAILRGEDTLIDGQEAEPHIPPIAGGDSARPSSAMVVSDGANYVTLNFTGSVTEINGASIPANLVSLGTNAAGQIVEGTGIAGQPLPPFEGLPAGYLYWDGTQLRWRSAAGARPPVREPNEHISLEEFRLVMPCFGDPAKYSNDMILRYIDMLPSRFRLCTWGANMHHAQALWIAHHLLMDDMGCPNEGGGALAGLSNFATSKRVGDVSVTYSNIISEKALDNPYYLTQYGREYLFMLKNMAGGVGIAII
jgi:hypothetical protein